MMPKPSPEFVETIAKALKAARAESETTLDDVAIAMRNHGSCRQAGHTVWMWENKRSTPTAENLVTLARVFGWSLDEMFGLGEYAE